MCSSLTYSRGHLFKCKTTSYTTVTNSWESSASVLAVSDVNLRGPPTHGASYENVLCSHICGQLFQGSFLTCKLCYIPLVEVHCQWPQSLLRCKLAGLDVNKAILTEKHSWGGQNNLEFLQGVSIVKLGMSSMKARHLW